MNCHLLNQDTFDFDSQMFVDEVSLKYRETDSPQKEYSLSFCKCAKCGQNYLSCVKTHYAEYMDYGSDNTYWIPISEQERKIIHNDYRKISQLLGIRKQLTGNIYRNRGKIYVSEGKVRDFSAWFPEPSANSGHSTNELKDQSINTNADTQIVSCNKCGAKNKVVIGINSNRQAVCGCCKQPLETLSLLILPEQIRTIVDPIFAGDRIILGAAVIAELILQRRIALEPSGFSLSNSTPTNHKVLDAGLKVVSHVEDHNKYLDQYPSDLKKHPIAARIYYMTNEICHIAYTEDTHSNIKTFVEQELIRRGLFKEIKKKGWIFTETIYEFVNPKYEQTLKDSIRQAVMTDFKADERMSFLLTLIGAAENCHMNGFVKVRDNLGLFGYKDFRKKIEAIIQENQSGKELYDAIGTTYRFHGRNRKGSTDRSDFSGTDFDYS